MRDSRRMRRVSRMADWESGGESGRGSGKRQFGGGGGGFEGEAGAGGDAPAIAGDLDELAVEVGEIEEDLVGGEGGTTGIDAKGDADIAGLGFAGGLGFEVVEDGGEGGCGGKVFGLGVALVEEPFAEGLGQRGSGSPDFVRERRRRCVRRKR